MITFRRSKPCGVSIIARVFIFLTAAGVAVGLGAWAEARQEAVYFRIATGPSDSTSFAVGGILASAISNPPGSRPCGSGGSCGVPGLIAAALATNGALDNVEAISKGTVESGLVSGDVAFWASRGGGPFEGRGPVKKIATVASLYPEAVHLVVRRDSGIKRIQSLAGKRVSLGTERSAVPIVARAILRAYGVDGDGTKYVNEGPLRSAEMLSKSQIDAFFVIAGQPAPAIADLAETTPLTLLPIKGKQADGLISRLPFLSRSQIDAALYGDVPGVPTLSMPAQWLISDKVDENLVYALTRSLWHPETKKLLEARHPAGLRIRVETALEDLSVPLHPGAARYYREIGALR